MPKTDIESRILAVLSVGPVSSRSGQAMARLIERMVDCPVGPQAASNAVKRMAERGTVTREVRGRRTFEIKLVEPINPAKPVEEDDLQPIVLRPVPPLPSEPAVELDELADAMLRRVAEILEGPQLAQVDAERLSNALDEAQRLRGKVRSLESELEGVRSERDTQRGRVRVLEGDKRTLQANLDQALRKGGRVIEEQVREQVGRFMQERPTRHG